MKSRFLLIAAIILSTSSLMADSPTGWDRRVLPTGDYRTSLRKTEIRQRPGRPFHVYGNTVRFIDQATASSVVYRPLRRIILGTDSLEISSQRSSR